MQEGQPLTRDKNEENSTLPNRLESDAQKTRAAQPEIGRRFNYNRIIRAGIGTGYRMRTLFAEILDDQSAAPVTLALFLCQNTFGSKAEIPGNL